MKTIKKTNSVKALEPTIEVMQRFTRYGIANQIKLVTSLVAAGKPVGPGTFPPIDDDPFSDIVLEWIFTGGGWILVRKRVPKRPGGIIRKPTQAEIRKGIAKMMARGYIMRSTSTPTARIVELTATVTDENIAMPDNLLIIIPKLNK